MQLNKTVAGFRAFPGFRALKAIDGPSALYPGTTAFSKHYVCDIRFPGGLWPVCQRVSRERSYAAGADTSRGL